jgi:hypothetical protein
MAESRQPSFCIISLYLPIVSKNYREIPFDKKMAGSLRMPDKNRGELNGRSREKSVSKKAVKFRRKIFYLRLLQLLR